MEKNHIIIVCGPTATGKSDYAVDLALRHDGEIVSADSRQVYKGLDIGSGKITKAEMRGVPHHLIDITSPQTIYTVAQFKKDAERAIADIIARGKTPIICGGTGFYIDALMHDSDFPEVPINTTLRTELERKSLTELCTMLETKDPERYASIDIHNKVRIIRALEIIDALGAVPAQVRTLRPDWNIDIHYLDWPDDILKNRIHKRLITRINEGMIDEVRTLHNQGLSWTRCEELGLEYRYIAFFLQEKLSREDMIIQLEYAIWHYAKRQRTWFKKYLPYRQT